MVTERRSRTTAAMRGHLLILAMASLLPGCGTLYVAQAATGQLQVMSERRPIDKVIADPATDAVLRARLTEAKAIREFASRELDLPDNSSYRTYADIQRPYVVWNVVVTPEFSLEPLQWCFPIAGCVAYRGYFKEQRARDFALEQRARGYDTVVGGVAAYSTLGRFADPVLSSMLSYGDNELAALVFHELAHQVLYVQNDTSFNEAFAVTVEQAGLARWLVARDRSPELDVMPARRARQAEAAEMFKRRRLQLQSLYASSVSEAKMRAAKAQIMQALAEDILAFEARHKLKSRYSAWIGAGLNNAHFASLATYFDCVPGFERLLASVDGDLPTFFAAARKLANEPAPERRRRLCALDQAARDGR